MKKLGLLFATSVMIMLFAFSASALDPTGQCGDNAYWTFDESTGVLVISGDGEIYESAFDSSYDQYNITSVIIKDGITRIGAHAFYNCHFLSELVISDTVISIGAEAFENTGLINVFIPQSIINIEDGAFSQCKSLDKFQVDINNNSYSTDEHGVLYNKDKTALIQYPIGNKRTSYSIASSTEVIKHHSFLEAKNLVEIDIPKSVTTIGSQAFLWCDKLSKIEISENVKVIGDRAFSDCDNLKMIKVDNDNSYYCNDEYGVLFNKDKTILLQYSIGNERKIYDIPNGVNHISDEAFFDAIYLNEINISNTVESIGTSAFASSGITDLKIPNSVKTIGYYSFSQCNNLKEVNISESVTNIVERAFLGCENLTTILVNENNSRYSNDDNGVLFNKDKTILIQYPIGKESYYYMIPETVTIISDNAFYECNNIRNVTVPNSILSIGGNAFAYCDNLKHMGYKGTEKQWKEITIDNSYTEFKNPEFLHYKFNCETDITERITSPTCKKEGLKSTVCTCGYIYSAEAISVVNCSFTTYTDDYNATCLDNGTKTSLCDYDCGNKNTITIEGTALGHDIVSYEGKAPTCIEKGCNEYETCLRCSYSTYKAIPALGHDMSEYIVTKESTCTEKGEKRADCSRCDYFKTKKTDLKQHIDANGDEYCDVCELYLPSLDCLCVCHAKTIGAFVYKLFSVLDNIFGTRLLEKVFNISEYCACGLKH